MHPASDFQIEIFVQFGAFWLQLPIEIWVILNVFLVWGKLIYIAGSDAETDVI